MSTHSKEKPKDDKDRAGSQEAQGSGNSTSEHPGGIQGRGLVLARVLFNFDRGGFLRIRAARGSKEESFLLTSAENNGLVGFLEDE